MRRNLLTILVTATMSSCVAGSGAGSYLDDAVAIGEEMAPRVAEALGVAPIPSFTVREARGLPPNTAAYSIRPDQILLHPVLDENPRSALVWVMTHELVHLHRPNTKVLPAPLRQVVEWVEEGIAEYHTAQLLPEIAPLAARHRAPSYQMAFDFVSAVLAPPSVASQTETRGQILVDR